MALLEGKTILVTGGGNGIGKACALLAAELGAKVLVNDLGGGLAGDDTGAASPAEAIANEIRARGGEAISNSESVAEFSSVKAMVEQAIDELGGLDAVINPAGILRDGMFHKMPVEDWDSVLNVHLKGAFNVARASVDHFRAKESGSLVLFTSTSGLIGNLGQANYAAAKMGVVGLSRILAMEGARQNVRSNVIAPFAWTRMIASIPVKDEASAQRVERMRLGMRPEQVAQLAVTLCADAAKDVSGQIFCVRGNEIQLFSQPRPVKSVARMEGWTPETILDQALPAMSGSFTDLAPSATVFPYDPV
ncbi:SDR family NAD(P)-dependent oxidoreductase [Henriciella mobilis]|uniref:SDR family oxidoreductase n=1 Tax=Henriciella mobilis TaxID=2305467 RepID=A0A399RND4_9PROT|nr:SDR family NAD(P)-dependent oxidoreductase [Henriciella mobilis]RIJ32708.1 SDR family oxidoreductase [Henriciella mobilis]